MGLMQVAFSVIPPGADPMMTSACSKSEGEVRERRDQLRHPAYVPITPLLLRKAVRTSYP